MRSLDDRCWIVTYQYEQKPRPTSAGVDDTGGRESSSGAARVSNVALRGIHPAVWLSRPPETFRRFYVQRLLFFAEIDHATFQAISAANYISCEDHTADGETETP